MKVHIRFFKKIEKGYHKESKKIIDVYDVTKYGNNIYYATSDGVVNGKDLDLI